jgi:hypothetical protein
MTATRARVNPAARSLACSVPGSTGTNTGSRSSSAGLAG